jgi:hypothetical protein
MTASTNAHPRSTTTPYFACGSADLTYFDHAPVKFVTEVDLDVDPDRLFSILDDPASWPAWARPGIARVVWTSPQPRGVGATRTVHMLGGLEVDETFFVWSPGRELAFHFTGTTQKVWERFAERYEIRASGAGRCHLTWTVAYEPAGGFARVHFLVKPIMARVLRSYLRNLQAYVRNASH